MRYRVSLVILLVGLTHLGFSQQEIPMTTDIGKIVLIFDNTHVDASGAYSVLEGSIRNETPFTLSTVVFQVTSYDETGTDVKMCDQYNNGFLCSFFVVQPVESGQSVRLDRLGGTFYPTHPVPKQHHIAKVEYSIVRIKYLIKYDVHAEPMVNDSFTITSTFSQRGLALEFRNTSSDVIEIAWDQSVYIHYDGTSSRLIRSNVRLSEKDRPQPNTVIPPGAKLQETVFPVDRVRQSSDGGLYQEALLPEATESRTRAAELGINALVGREVKVFLRLIVNDQKQNVTIPFKVVSVKY
jgi:hypothetical protein